MESISDAASDGFVKGNDPRVEGLVGRGEEGSDVLSIFVSSIGYGFGWLNRSKSDLDFTHFFGLDIIVRRGELAAENCVEVDGASCDDVLPLRVREFGAVRFKRGFESERHIAWSEELRVIPGESSLIDFGPLGIRIVLGSSIEVIRLNRSGSSLFSSFTSFPSLKRVINFRVVAFDSGDERREASFGFSDIVSNCFIDFIVDRCVRERF
jgi:hypothetical protein